MDQKLDYDFGYEGDVAEIQTKSAVVESSSSPSPSSLKSVDAGEQNDLAVDGQKKYFANFEVDEKMSELIEKTREELSDSENVIFLSGKNEIRLKIEKLAEQFNTELPEERKYHIGHISHLAADFLDKASKELEGFGIEGELDEDRGLDFQYVNMGDMYALTILFDGKENKFTVSTWADMIEKQEREYEELCLNKEKEEMELEYGGKWRQTLAMASDPPPYYDDRQGVIGVGPEDSGESIRGKYVSFRVKGSTNILNGKLKDITEKTVILCRNGTDMKLERDMGVLQVLPSAPERENCPSAPARTPELDRDLGR
jgi:hypothetical protein